MGYKPPSSDNERLEPKMSPFSSFDEEPEPHRGDYQRSHKKTRRSSRSYADEGGLGQYESKSKGIRPGLFWTFTLTLLLLLGSAIAIGFMTYLELKQNTDLTANDVEKLVAASDSFGEKLDTTDTSFDQSQQVLQSQVESLDKELKKLQESQAQSIESVQTQLSQRIAALSETTTANIGQTQTKVETAMQKSMQQAIKQQVDQSVAQAVDKSVKNIVAPLQAATKTAVENLKGFERQFAPMSQDLSLLKEDIANLPVADIEKLQNQLVTYMQSIDRFRQQTNASLNEISRRLDQLYRAPGPNERQNNQGFGG